MNSQSSILDFWNQMPSPCSTLHVKPSIPGFAQRRPSVLPSPLTMEKQSSENFMDRTVSTKFTERRFQQTMQTVFKLHKKQEVERKESKARFSSLKNLQNEAKNQISFDCESDEQSKPVPLKLKKTYEKYQTLEGSGSPTSIQSNVKQPKSKPLSCIPSFLPKGELSKQKLSSNSGNRRGLERSGRSERKSQKTRKASSGIVYQLTLDENNSDEDSQIEERKGKDDSFQDCRLESLSSFSPKLMEVSSSNDQRRKSKARLREFKQYDKCLILPDDPWKIKWNVFLIIVIWISSIISPFRAAFYETNDILWMFIESFIDLVFLLDIIFSFLTAYYNEIEALITSKKAIAINYLKTWFIIDLITILPLSLITNNSVNNLGAVARLPRVYKMIKAFKFFRLTKIWKTRNTMRNQISKLNSIEVERVIEFSLTFTILCHNLTCLWFLFARFQDFNEDTWVVRYGYENASTAEQYVASLYFIAATITTVGYGDINSRTVFEQAFSVVLMLIGVIAYSTAISSILSIMNASNNKQRRLREKLDILGNLRMEYNIPFETYWKLRRSLHYEHKMDLTDYRMLLQELPLKISIELSHIMYSQQLNEVSFFKDKSPHFIASIAPLLKPIKVCKGEYLYLKDDQLDGIYFIKEGKSAYVEKKVGADLIFASHLAGSHFGDIDFTASSQEKESRRLFSVKALSDMDLLFLRKEDLFELDLEFKKEIIDLFQHSHATLKKLRRMVKKGKNLFLANQDSYRTVDFDGEEGIKKTRQDDNESLRSFYSKQSKNESPEVKKRGLKRSVTLHKRQKIGKMLQRNLNSPQLIEKQSKYQKSNSQTLTYKEGVIEIKGATTISEEQNESQTVASFRSFNQSMITQKKLPLSQFTIKENVERERQNSERQDEILNGPMSRDRFLSGDDSEEEEIPVRGWMKRKKTKTMQLLEQTSFYE